MSSTSYGPTRTPTKQQHPPSDTAPYEDERASSEIMHLQVSNAGLRAENSNLKTQMNHLNASVNGLKGTVMKLDLQRRELIKHNKMLEDKLLFAHSELVWATRAVSDLNRVGAPAVEKEGDDEIVGAASVSSSAAEESSDPPLAPLTVSPPSRATRETTIATAALVTLGQTDTEGSLIASGAEVASMFEQAKKSAADTGKGPARKADDKETVEKKMATGDPRRNKRQKTTHASESEGPYGGGYV